MMADLPLRTAHATCPVETGAQDGLPIPVAVPVETKFPHVAHAAGAISRPVDNIRNAAIFFMVSSLTLKGAPENRKHALNSAKMLTGRLASLSSR
jgi:hypothetical protein